MNNRKLTEFDLWFAAAEIEERRRNQTVRILEERRRIEKATGLRYA